MRATAQNQQVAGLMGIDINRVISLTFVIGAALGAVAGVMVGSYYGIAHYQMGFILGLKAFSAAVLGGIGNLAGAMLGGLLLGVIEALGAGYVGDLTNLCNLAGWSDALARALRSRLQPHALRLQLPGRVRVPGADRRADLPARPDCWASASPTAPDRGSPVVQRVACRGCDLLQRLPPLPPGGKARCGRCGQTARRAALPIRSIARSRCAIAAAIALVIANVTPLMSLSVGRPRRDDDAHRRRARRCGCRTARSTARHRRVLRGRRAGAATSRCCSPCCSRCGARPRRAWAGDADALGRPRCVRGR